MKKITMKKGGGMWKYVLILALIFSSVVYQPIVHKCYAEDFKPGYCPITGNQIIDDNGKRLPNYSSVWFELSDGRGIRIALDKSAVITEADFPKLMEWVKAGWEWEMNRDNWPPQRVREYKDAFFNLTIVKIMK